MAKRIITNGKYAKITCTCECVYSFDETDIEENGKVICPECGAENTPTVKKQSVKTGETEINSRSSASIN